MDISERLIKISDFVKYKKIADIGTDHGYIPIYLTKKDKIIKAIACDINKLPLKKAEENITNYGYNSIIETRLGSGLEKIGVNEVESAIIAGMGGMLIIDILSKSMDCARSLKQLILQPQRDLYNVRKFLIDHCFNITKEEILIENNIYYNIIECNYNKSQSYREEELLFGKIDNHLNKKTFLQYVLFEKNNYLKVINKLKTSSTGNNEKINLLENKIRLCEVILNANKLY